MGNVGWLLFLTPINRQVIEKEGAQKRQRGFSESMVSTG